MKVLVACEFSGIVRDAFRDAENVKRTEYGSLFDSLFRGGGLK